MSQDVVSKLQRALRSGLAAAAEPGRAEPMRAYMKSAMPYYGVPSAEMRRVSRSVFAAYPLPDFETWTRATLVLWREARRREERYAAIELTGDRRYQSHQKFAALPMYEEMIVTGAWWDYVDPLAGHRIGGLLRTYPAKMKPVLRRWAKGGDLWKRRSAILSQLTFKAETDLELLYACIQPNFGDPEFFIRKAIGWALRQYAWTNPEEIRRFVRTHEAKLSPLSRREALKNIGL